MKDIVRFDLCEDQQGRENFVSVLHHTSEIDTENRIVLCQNCGAILDPF